MRYYSKNIFVFLIFLFAFAERGKSQILSTANLNLLATEYINDVVYDPYHDCYIVVGKFTSINGFARKNIAFINASDLSVNTDPNLFPLSNIDGEIRSVAITSTSTFTYTYYHLYIGGNFQTITSGSTYTRKGIAKFTASKTNLLPIVITNFSVSSWNADLDMTPLLTGYNSEGVDDILITNDTVIFSGRFFAVNNSTIYDLRDGVAAYTIGGTLLAYPNFSSSGTYLTSRFFVINKFGANLFIGGYVNGGTSYDGRLFKTDVNGNILAGFNYAPGNLKTVYNFYELDDSLLIVADDRNANNNQPDVVRVFRQSNGTEKLNHCLSPQSSLIGGIVGHSSLAQYKHYIYSSTNQLGYSVISYENTSNSVPVSGIDWNATATNNLTATFFSHIHVAGSHLFVSAPNLATLSGASKLRLGVYCLEPADAKFFTISDSTICAGDIRTFTIPPVDFADGYTWEYTGNGGDLQNNGSLDSGPIDIALVSGNSIQIKFTSIVTSGQLIVSPYSICNGSTKIYSNTIITNIAASQLPQINAGLDTVLTCYNDTIGLYGYSTSPGVTYEWKSIVPPLYILPGQFDEVEEPGNYVFKVTNPVGCSSYDTVFVDIDTITPTPILPSPPYEINCAIPVKDFLGSTSTPNTTLEWYQGVTFFPNPITVSAEGGYYLLVTDTINGCWKAEGIYVVQNIIQPTITLPDYPGFNIAYAVDTILCDPNFLSLVCASSTANTTSTWINSDTTLFFGDTMIVTSPGNYTAFATDNSNGCTNTLNINIASFQNIPGIGISGDTILNCSVDSLSLFGSSLSSGSTFEWSGIFVPVSTNPLTVYDAGVYYFTVTNPDNGCTSSDSVIVSETNEINVFAGNNLLACDQDFVNLTATYTGNITGINYLWNTGTTASNEIYIAGNSSYGTVEVFGDNGCYGVDTVYINLPSNPVINFQGFKPCDNNPSGQIVATPVSGTAPFQYSIDGGINYQTSPIFTGLYIGTYPIWVKDSLLCDYQFEAVIDGNSSLPEPKFLFSTYNFASDTIVIIDVSNPPTDSTVWEFPTEITVLDYNELSPTILLPDTGVFQITMKAFYGNCLVEVTRPIYAAMFDSTAANNYNQNGIKSIELYPNPTSGNFTVTVEFYKSQRAAMVVQDMIGNTYVFNEYEETLTISQDVFLDLSVLDGTYVLKLISEFDSAYITFILAR